MSDAGIEFVDAIARLLQQRADLARQLSDMDARIALVRRAVGGDKSCSAAAQRAYVAKRKARGICARCSHPAAIRSDGRVGTLCESHRDMWRQMQRERYAREHPVPRNDGRGRPRINGADTAHAEGREE